MLDGWACEQGRKRKLLPANLLHPVHHLGGEERMSAQIEKAVA